MPIKCQPPPEKSLQALQSAARRVPKTYEHVAEMIRQVVAHPEQAWPHPVYVAGLRDMASAQGLRRAEPTGWRYLARSGSDRNYAIEVQHDEDGDRHQLSEVDKGPYIDGMYKVLADQSLARKLGAVLYRPALLRINAMRVFAVWLQTRDQTKDILIPIPPAPPFLSPWQPYSVREFQDALRDEAKEQLATDSSDA
jgi:hypothetical protein